MAHNGVIGFDVGGTKCAVILGLVDGAQPPRILGKSRFPTRETGSPSACLDRMCREAKALLSEHGVELEQLTGVGISCGGPLDSRRGVILSPPNLPGWIDVPAVELVSKHFSCPVRLQNDANAGAVAEWKFGAGRGFRSLAFLTFGTGLGAGLILDGRLYAGADDLAGECGHLRLAPYGPVGFGKAGSFEGFCSGGGLAQLARCRVREALQSGESVAWCASLSDQERIDAKLVADAADGGDELARSIYAECGSYLGRGLSILIDLLNLEAIVIGSIFARSESLLRPAMEREIAREAIPAAARRCRVVPAALAERIGDYAALAVAAGEF